MSWPGRYDRTTPYGLSYYSMRTRPLPRIPCDQQRYGRYCSTCVVYYERKRCSKFVRITAYRTKQRFSRSLGTDMGGGERLSNRGKSQHEALTSSPRFRVGDKVQAASVTKLGQTCPESFDVESVDVSKGMVKYTLSANGVIWNEGQHIEDRDLAAWQEATLNNVADQIISTPPQMERVQNQSGLDGMSFENDWSNEWKEREFEAKKFYKNEPLILNRG